MTRGYIPANANLQKLIACMDRANDKLKRATGEKFLRRALRKLTPLGRQR